jgi:TatD DNase family protein
LNRCPGTLEEAKRYVALGFLISINTSVTHPKAQALREVAAALPLAALLVETDSPYGAPQAYRGKRNEPAYVAEAVKTIAAIRGITPEEVAAVTTANAKRLFGLPDATPASVAELRR